MKRRLIAVAAAAALGLAVVPATTAAAAAEQGTAALTAGKDVFPGVGQTYKVSITNSSLNSAVNLVRLTFPPSAVGVTAAAVQPKQEGGWTTTRAVNGASLFFAGGSIPARGSFEFTFVSDVARPAVDRAGKFAVTLSSNGGASGFAATESGANSLLTTVRVLEVLDAGPLPTAPAGVVDGSATGRQAITYGYTVANRGSASLEVTAALAKGRDNPADDVVGEVPAAVVAPGTQQGFSFPVTLGQADRGDRISTFIGTARATGATAPAKAHTLAVQKPALLALSKVAPSVVRPGISSGFVGTVTKSGSPTLTLTSGSLSFARTTAPLAASTAIGKNEPVDLSFTSTKVVGDGSAASPVAPDGDNKSYPVTVAGKVTDGNGFSYDLANTLNNGITLDALAPVVTVAANLPLDADGSRQTAAKNGDTIGVSGSVNNCADTLNFVELRPNVGAAFPVAVNKGPATPDGTCSFSGSVKPAAFDANASTFVVVAQASDLAGNTGGTTTAAFPIDNVAPVLTFSQTVSSTRIAVTFTEANRVLGGCNPTQYKVDGDPLVTQVLYSDGTPCRAGQAGPSNERILVLSTPKPEEFTSTLEYRPGTRPSSDPAKDGAGSDAPLARVQTVQGVIPAPPVLVNATRNAGQEVAVSETSGGVRSFFTRFSGDDLLLEFTGGRAGYQVQVSDAAGTVLRKQAATGSPSTVRIPLGTSPDGTYGFRLQLLNQSAIPSDPVSFNVVLDRVAPKMASVTPGLAVNGSASSVAVTFTEPLAAGSDFAFDWTVVQDGTFLAVTKVTPTNRTTRTLDTQEPVQAGTPVSAIYEIVSPGAKRYEDRAGNQLANGTSS